MLTEYSRSIGVALNTLEARVRRGRLGCVTGLRTGSRA
uniref:Uncharacterized protein n=1 Tax=Arundo donax TaxID=35708 RepID=A0A0A8ZZQ3_ARUDO